MNAVRHIATLLTCALVMLGSSVHGAEDQAIKDAIDRGVAHLKKQQGTDGAWPPYASNKFGPTALAGLTLLECGVPETDPSIRKAAELLREGALSMTDTYSLALTIIFFDKLDSWDGDRLLIQSMAVRLYAGQNASGGWGYSCPSLAQEEMSVLRTELRKAGPSDKKVRSERPTLPRRIKKHFDQITQAGFGVAPTDNSNTQFATLAMWTARRHGIPVEGSLALVERRFCESQNADGGWGYKPESGGAGQSFGTMTCAGLLGLAAGHGAVKEGVELRTKLAATEGQPRLAGRVPPIPQRAINNALRLLGTLISQPIVSVNSGERLPLFHGAGDEYYFLWSLERMAMIYGLEKIGGQDWYEWGSKYLLAKQSSNGSWSGKYLGTGVDSCFALLFLKRANQAKDLSATLLGELRNPGKITLSAGQDATRRQEKEKTSASDPKPERPTTGHEKAKSPTVVAVNKEVERLANLLLRSQPMQQKTLIKEFKEHKGFEYTEALALSIHQLNAPMKEQAREALAERMARMTAATLHARLNDDDSEIRRAAALACAMKEDRTQIPDLIELLNDREPTVSRAAYAALKDLTNKDFGPAANSGTAERTAAVGRWKEWWKQTNAR